ncbi:hypothetical protein sos41_23590 [Alphaproteobacteria bacterium SO-S41]|nr:hypothetical protein sos41_23590 [Alphaproteobacteria bacterium SO-S41]
MTRAAKPVFSAAFARLVVGFLALLGIVGVTYWLGERAQTLFETVVAARDARSSAVELRNELLAAESSSRGFLVTGNEIYLSPYDRAKARAGRQLAVVESLFEPYAEMEKGLERLKALIAEKFAEMDLTLQLKRQREDQKVLDVVRTNRGKALMDEANVFFAGLIRAAESRLNAGVAGQRANAQWLRWFSIGGAIVIVAFVGSAALATLRYARNLGLARDEVTLLNESLEARVEDRTAALQRERDKAELLLGEVNHRVANSLALVSSLVTLQANAIEDKIAKEALAETRARIYAVSQVHKKLYSSNDVRSVALDEYLAGLLDHLNQSLKSADRGITLTHDLEPLHLPTDASINLGVVLTEWVTNAVKYAYPDKPGEIRVLLKRDADQKIELRVEDDGVGRSEVQSPAGSGLGTRIVNAMATSMKAQIAYIARHPGTAASLLFPAQGNLAGQSA